MPEIAAGVFETLIPRAVSQGLSANQTLQILRSFGYQKQTQAFFNLYRQARSVYLATPELSILANNAYVPDNLMQSGSPTQSYPYQYKVRYETLHGETGETRTAYYTLGSSTSLTKGQVLGRGSQLAIDALETTNVSLTDIGIESASARGEI